MILLSRVTDTSNWVLLDQAQDSSPEVTVAEEGSEKLASRFSQHELTQVLTLQPCVLTRLLGRGHPLADFRGVQCAPEHRSLSCFCPGLAGHALHWPGPRVSVHSGECVLGGGRADGDGVSPVQTRELS
jgi:hypothetical protein